MSDILVDIPNLAGWPLKRIDKLCSLVRRGTAPVYVEISKVKAIGQRCVTHQDFDPSFARGHSVNAVLNVLKAEPSDVLINSTGTGTIGRSVVFNDSGEYIIDGHVTVLRPQQELVDSRWLNAVIRSKWFQCHLERFCYTGSTNQMELSRTNLALSVLPTPDEHEQSIIGDVLDVIDNQIRETETIITKIQQVKQGLLHDLLTRGVDENGELRPTYQNAPELYKPSELGWIPKDWETCPLAKHINLLSGQHIESNLCNENAKGVPYFTGPSDFSRETTYVSKYTEYPQIMCSKGDILITVKGSGCGKVAISSTSACISRQLMAVQIDQTTIHFWYALFQNYQQKFNQMATGGNIPGVSRDQILKLVIRIPKSKDELVLIGSLIEGVSGKLSAEELVLEKLKLQKSGLMDDLLTGKKRVTDLLKQKQVS